MTGQTFKIKPAKKGLQVLDPKTRDPLDEAGEEKPRDEYWLRRLKDGDVVIIKSIKKETSE
ncbi:DUF2635 domain-containing protein [Hydrogenovibrio marinus]|uniref:DUF2635 domain-containing protein n=1 Tax=Hydrogenovibrio marinus TaxID=28885 RepID=A0A066ZRG3_HYDMR|nr:DUF2635 domain-containing protein [Hydrogenovibrio marinus]KDN94859.1 hypothetical protein EI16_00655 [Hydrogenovibrio marinus]BBN59319.1 DUF2635 domain-containing protein [Hydrogenovibrio marinus]